MILRKSLVFENNKNNVTLHYMELELTCTRTDNTHHTTKKQIITIKERVTVIHSNIASDKNIHREGRVSLRSVFLSLVVLSWSLLFH